jgi:hypothetical protein
LNDSNQNRRDGQKQQNMDESAQGVGGGHSKQPQQEQDYTNGPQHVEPPSPESEVLALRLCDQGEVGWSGLGDEATYFLSPEAASHMQH